ncbi:alanine racemase [Demequina aestuarii]|uniref:alanine racemase n=1 Tax=Demequina aestuarii TaxID=327095 RepID=UPI001EE75EDA|nr:alanine racemase [Demequina aestuarii]
MAPDARRMTPVAPTTLAGTGMTVSAAAVTHNTRYFASRTAAAVMAVVKADGYGHGAATVARAALAGGATWLGVTSLAEALDLRTAGLSAPILSWLNPVQIPVETAVRARVDLAVSSLSQLRWCGAGQRWSAPVRVHLHLDTGLARDGAPPAEWAQLCAEAAALEREGRVSVVGIMSHMSHADEPSHPANAVARARFANALDIAHGAGLTPLHRHLAATSAAAGDPASHHTLVRIGAGLVGIDLSGASAGSLVRAMTVTAPVLMTRSVARGTPVGYGGQWHAPATTTLATVQVGYADGVPRVAGGRAFVAIHGRRCRLVGRVSMDQIVVDATGTAVSPGDVATVWGPGVSGEPTIDEWAQWSGTIPHEIVTGVSHRMRRAVSSAAAGAAR